MGKSEHQLKTTQPFVMGCARRISATLGLNLKKSKKMSARDCEIFINGQKCNNLL